MAENTLTIEQAIGVAIKEEVKAYNLYLKTSEKVAAAGTKSMLQELAQQEKGHKNLLESVLKGGDFKVLGKKVPQQSPGIASFLKISELGEHATPQEVMIFAMGEEEKACNFYLSLKDHFSGTDMADLFDRLAAEERGHKIRLEDEYEKHFMREN
jgi:rubrerythrin